MLEKLMDAETFKSICLIGVCVLFVLTLRESWLTRRLNKKTRKALSEIEALKQIK